MFDTREAAKVDKVTAGTCTNRFLVETERPSTPKKRLTNAIAIHSAGRPGKKNGVIAAFQLAINKR